VQQVRNLNVHEYVAFGLMGENGVRLPKGQVASSAEEAAAIHASGSLGTETVIKAQVLAGGRGRGTFTNGFQGGVKVVSSADEAKEIAGQMIGSSLVTKQTGEEGKPCNKVFVMEKLDIGKEAYFSILMDRAHGGPTIVGSPAGGMSIEDVAHDTPEKIFKEEIDVMDGISDERLTALARNMGFDTDSQVAQATETMRKLYDMFMKTDATLVEINPLATTKGGDGK
jgi:succinyl-CoA synthetase beta subunit